jgi:hypothetical protein
MTAKDSEWQRRTRDDSREAFFRSLFSPATSLKRVAFGLRGDDR